MTLLDWLIVATYMAAVMLLGGIASRQMRLDSKKNALREYFLAGRSLGVLAVTASIIATETSAATFIGGPDTAFRGDLAYLQTTIGAICSRFFLAYFFIEVYYRHGVVTVYEYLAKRFSSVVQVVCALFFSFGRTLASGARLYIAALAVATIIGVPIPTVIVGIAVVAIVYAVFGGLRAVVWTDAMQAVLFLAVACYVLLFIFWELDAWHSSVAMLDSARKLKMFDFQIDIFSAAFWKNPYTFVGAIVGGFSLGVATHGTDQDMVQRMLACRTSKESKRALILAGLVEIPVALLFVSVGLALWLFYQNATPPGSGESVFPFFIATELPSGIRGLLVAAILAAAMSSLDSALTALSAVSVTDIFVPIRRGAALSERQLLRLSRGISLFWGVVLAVAAVFLAASHQAIVAEVAADGDLGRTSELLTLALGIMALFYGPVLGVFLTAIFTKRGSTTSILCGLFAGVLAVTCVRKALFFELGWTWHTVVGTLISFMVAALGKTTFEIGDGRES